MDALYQSIITDARFLKASKRQRLAVERELSRRVKRIGVADLTECLSVSFPSQGGCARYEIQLSEGQKSVGAAFATERICIGDEGYTRVSVVLFQELLDVVTAGLFEPKQVEVMLGERLLGTIRKSGDVYKVDTPVGITEVRLESEYALVRDGEGWRRFYYQLDNDRLPNVFAFLAKAPLRNENFVFNPEIRSADPLVVMAFMLVVRMVYRGGDF